VVKLVVTGGSLTRRPQRFLAEATWQINEQTANKQTDVINADLNTAKGTA